MAKSKVPAVKDLNGYFFMGIRGNNVELVYHDDTDNGLAIGVALANVLEEDPKLFDIVSTALLTAIEARDNVKLRKEKYTSKKSNIVHKKPTKKVK